MYLFFSVMLDIYIACVYVIYLFKHVFVRRLHQTLKGVHGTKEGSEPLP